MTERRRGKAPSDADEEAEKEESKKKKETNKKSEKKKEEATPSGETPAGSEKKRGRPRASSGSALVVGTASIVERGDAFGCSLCDATFRSHQGAVFHVEAHSGALACPHCGASYTTRPGLTYHLKTAHPN
jgi:hypothetical protein